MKSGPPKLDQEMFLDRTSSKRLVSILRNAGFAFQTIYEIYPDNAHENICDPEWIKLCGQNNWIVVTGDKKIETVPENRQAVIDAKAKVFLLNDSNSKPEVWAAAVLLGHYKMQEIIDANSGPFFVTVGKRSDGHIQRIRRPLGYVEPRPEIAKSEEASQTPATPEPGPPEQIPASADGASDRPVSKSSARNLFSNLS